MGWSARSTFFPETHGYKTIRIKICIKKFRTLWALSWPTISHGTVKPVGLSANCYPGALWMCRAFDSVTKEKGNCYWQDLCKAFGRALTTNKSRQHYVWVLHWQKCHLFYTHLWWGLWVQMEPGRFCPVSFLPNVVGRFGLIFSESPWVRYDRSKKNVTLTPYPTLSYWVVFQCWTQVHFHYLNPYSSNPY